MTLKTTYEVLTEIEDKGLLTKAVEKELIETTSIFHKQVYELYLMYRNHEKKTAAVMSTSVESQMSERSLWYIIKKMES